jgi:hypothetical protein
VAAVLATLAAVAALGLPATGAAVSRPAAQATPAQAGHTTCVSSGASTTCTGTYSGNTAWEPTGMTHGKVGRNRIAGTAGHPNPAAPQVTVSQTTNLVNQEVQVSWANFTPSTSLVWPPPQNIPAASDTDYNVEVVECAGVDPPVFNPANGAGCYTLPPNTSGEGGGSGAANEVTAYTLQDGVGEANIYIEAGSEVNSFLGCDVTNPCSIAVVPNWGGVEPTTQTGMNCSDHSQDFVDVANDFNGMAGDEGANYIGYPCSWADRIVVPLSFGPTPTNCPQVTPQFYAAGSPMLERAMNQWIPGWCTGSDPLALNYTFRTTEQQARSDFLQPPVGSTAATDVAMTTLPPDAATTGGSTRKFTYAPLAVSAVAMSYYIDDPVTKTPITHLVLDPRLLAKLLTESYSLAYNCAQAPPPPWPQQPGAPSQTCDPAVVGNPETIFDDPEFLALNTHCAPLLAAANYTCTRADFPSDGLSFTTGGQFLPTVLAGNSDMTYELTRWLASNADASAFINGKVDPYDMHVNQDYIQQANPISQFATLDDGATWPASIDCSGGCQTGEWYATMQAAWNPVSGLDNVATDLASYQPTADSPYLSCPNGITCTNANQLSLAKWGQERIGARALFSVVDEGDAGEFQFPTSSLVNAAGAAVAPTAASMQAAVQDMNTNPDGITQYANFSSTDPAAYPVTMVDYAMVPTCGLSPAKASAIARFLTNVATTGQVPGLTPGHLAPGYAPLDAKQRTQTQAAAEAVKLQDCRSAPPDNTVSGQAGLNNVTSKAGSGKAGQATPSPTANSVASASTAAFGIKSPLSGLSGALVVLAVIFGALLVLGGCGCWRSPVSGRCWCAGCALLRRGCG